MEKLRYSDIKIEEPIRSKTIELLTKLEESMHYIIAHEEEVAQGIVNQTIPKDKFEINIGKRKLLRKMDISESKQKSFDRTQVKDTVNKFVDSLQNDSSTVLRMDVINEVNKIKSKTDGGNYHGAYCLSQTFFKKHKKYPKNIIVHPSIISYPIEIITKANEFPLVESKATIEDVTDAMKIGMLFAVLEGGDFTILDDLKHSTAVVLTNL